MREGKRSYKLAILTIAAKEIKLIKTQKVAVALILLYPVIVMLTLGVAFSGSGSIGPVNMAFYSPENLQGFDSNDFIEKVKLSSNVNLLIVDEEAKVRKAIVDRKAKVGLIIHEPELIHGRYVIDLLLDNSSLVSSEFFFQAANQAIRRAGFDTSRELLLELWNNLSRIRNDLKGEITRVDSFIEGLDATEIELFDLGVQVNAINIDEMRQKLNDQRSYLNEISVKINSFKGKVVSFREKSNENLQVVRNAQSSVDNYISILGNAREDIGPAKEYCENNQEVLNQVDEIIEACEKIIGAHQDLSNAESELIKARGDLDIAEQNLIAINAELGEVTGELEETQAIFESAHGDIDFFNSELSGLGETVDKINNLIGKSLDTKASVVEDLEQSKVVMNGFIEQLGELQGLSPEFLSNPIIINRVSVYNVNRLEIITPIALALVLLLTTILLTGVSFVTERNEGAYSRLLLSSTGKTSLFLGKVLGQLIFALIEAFIILALAVTAFNLKIAGSLLDIFLAVTVISISFITLGLFISNYTKIQSTTILAGLLVVIPMIFISGIIVPPELMSEAIQNISGFQPLSLGVLISTEVIVKGTAITSLLNEIAMLLVPSIIFFGFTLANKNL